MKNKNIFSPNEINKYLYCPYQWYYEKTLGRKFIYEKYKERNEKLGLKNNVKSNFEKGLNFHEKYYKDTQQKGFLKIIFLMLILLAVVYIIISLGK